MRAIYGSRYPSDEAIRAAKARQDAVRTHEDILIELMQGPEMRAVPIPDQVWQLCQAIARKRVYQVSPKGTSAANLRRLTVDVWNEFVAKADA